jgi:hypothetical protein
MSGQIHVPAALSPREISPRTHWIGGWMDLRTDLDDVERRQILPLQGIEL